MFDGITTLSILEDEIDNSVETYERTGELQDLARVRELIKEHRASRGIPYSAP